MVTKKQIPVIAYVRVSDIGGREELMSPELQLDAIRGMARREGLEIVRTITELDKSGRDRKRPGWNEAVQAVEKGEVRGIAVYNLSRFSRSMIDALRALDRIEKAGGALYTAEGDFGNTATGRLMRDILLRFAQFEVERITEGFEAAQTKAIARGIHFSVPHGYVRDLDKDSPTYRRLVPDPVAAERVRGIFERRADGWSWRRLALWFVEQGGSPKARVNPVTGTLERAATPMSMRLTVRNVTYLGHARHGSKVNVKAHEPIIDAALFHKANAVKGVYHKPDRSLSANMLLRGVACCEGCGYRLQVVSSRYKNPESGKLERAAVYGCKHLHCKEKGFARASELDAEVVSRIFAYINRRGPAHATKPGNDVGAQLRQAEAELAETEADLTAFRSQTKALRSMGSELWQETLDGYITVVNVARAVVDRLKTETDFEAEAVTLEAFWNEWTNESRSEWLQRVIDSCTVRTSHRMHIPVSDRLLLTLTITGEHVYVRRDGNTELVPSPAGSPGATGVRIRSKTGTPEEQEIGKRAMEVHLSKRFGEFETAEDNPQVLAVARELSDPDIFKRGGSKPSS